VVFILLVVADEAGVLSLWLVALCRREERVALRHRANAIVVSMVHESRMQVRGRRLLVFQTVIAFDPFAWRAVVAAVVSADLGHGSGGSGDGRCDQSHVRVAGAPGAYFAVCGRADSSSAAGE